MTDINRVRELAGKAREKRRQTLDAGRDKPDLWSYYELVWQASDERKAFHDAASPEYVTTLLDRLERAEKALEIAADLAEQIMLGGTTPFGGAKLIADTLRAALAAAEVGAKL